MAQNPIVTIEMEDGGKIVAELYPDIAPISVNNFISLINKGFYDGLIFHRAISGFMIQGGDPQGIGIGGPGYCIKGEFASNGVANPLSHSRGVLSMARAQSPNSAGSQFFIMHADGDFLDGQYAAFGKVTEGMDVVDRVAAVKTNFSDKPKEDQRMKKVTVDTFGVTYPEPEKM
ncbi:MAG: peptidylprolyl isomerase [Evtepia sp.]|uniref:peptidylprolyl isomerase n=1 Tax=Evtepia sp. TaxID=2773933 RepID=UPI002A74EFAE|nr:peptidylprolyl isomerase [Evtepia sp.]MDY3014383.1 peptidylprolyl isomerase [Evtepia sp.]